MFLRLVSIWRLKPLLGKGSTATSLPIGLNRISWKRSFATVRPPPFQTLPIGLNRISWKRNDVGSSLNSTISPTDWVKSD